MGDTYKACCPFHSEDTPSFVVNPSLQIFKCFGAGCGQAGNAVKFVSLYENIEYKDAIDILAARYNLNQFLSEQENLDIDNINKTAAQIYQSYLFDQQEGLKARRYLKTKRGISKDTAKAFELGYAPKSMDVLRKGGLSLKQCLKTHLIVKNKKGNMGEFFKGRIIFPLHYKSKIVGFAGRALYDQQAKYINSKESDHFKKREIFYGWHQNKNQIRNSKHAFIVEGYMDVIQAYEKGLKNFMAISGTAFTPSQAEQLCRIVNKVTLFLDGDNAGIKSGLRICSLLAGRDIDIEVIAINGYDPDDILSHRKLNWQAFLEKHVQSLVEFLFYFNPGSKEDRLIATLRSLPYRPRDLKYANRIRQLAEITGEKEEDLFYWSSSMHNNVYTKTPNQNPKTEKIPAIEQLIVALYVSNKSLVYEDCFEQGLSSFHLNLLKEPTKLLSTELWDRPYIQDLIAKFNLKSDKNKLIDDLYLFNKQKIIRDQIKEYRSSLAKNPDNLSLINKIQQLVESLENEEPAKTR